MRIFIPVIDFGRGGGYRVLSELATAWAGDLETIFVSPTGVDPPYYPTAAQVTYVSPAGSPRQEPGSRSRFPALFRAQSALRCGLQRLVVPGDVVLSNHFLTVFPAQSTVRRGAIHVRLMQALEAEYNPGRNPKAMLLRRLALRADAVAPFVLTNSSQFLPDDPRRIGVLPAGIDTGLFRPFVRPPSEIPRIGTIGRTEAWKGTGRVLDALRNVASRTRVEIHVANFGFDLEPYRDLGIVQTQTHSDAELADWYRSLDAYVVGGQGQEFGFHYPCLESLACGVALITPPYAPANSANAWLVSSSDPVALAGGVEAMLANRVETLRRIRVGVHLAKDYAWPGIADQALEAIQAACPTGLTPR